MPVDPLAEILHRQPVCIVDGALATRLEERGCNLNHPLWSAKVLLEQPAEIEAVHTEYLQAGADCLITASYQGSIQGFMALGLSRDKSRQLLASSVLLAKNVRDRFWAANHSSPPRNRPLVAASIGPYGAYLADGSEYRGNYGLDDKALADFHRERMTILLAAGPDLLACETIPCLQEALVLARLVAEHPKAACWLSFTAADHHHTSNGEAIVDCARQLEAFPQVVAIGINCTNPLYVESLISEIRKGSSKPIVVYPNKGENWDAVQKIWQPGTATAHFSDLAKIWFDRGARIIGGCCRTGPEDIGQIAAWSKKPPPPEAKGLSAGPLPL